MRQRARQQQKTNTNTNTNAKTPRHRLPQHPETKRAIWNFAEKLSEAFCEGVEHKFSCGDGGTANTKTSFKTNTNNTPGVIDTEISGFRLAKQLSIIDNSHHKRGNKNNKSKIKQINKSDKNKQINKNFIAAYHKSKTASDKNKTNKNGINNKNSNGIIDKKTTAAAYDSKSQDVQGNHRGWGGATAAAANNNSDDKKSPIITTNGTAAAANTSSRLSKKLSKNKAATFGSGVINKAIRGLSLTKPTTNNKKSDNDDDDTHHTYTTENDHQEEYDILEQDTLYDTARFYEINDDNTVASSSIHGNGNGNVVMVRNDSRNDSLQLHSSDNSIPSCNKERELPSSSIGTNSNGNTHRNGTVHKSPQQLENLYSLPSSLVVSKQSKKQFSQQQHPRHPHRDRSLSSHDSIGSTSLSSFGASSRSSSMNDDSTAAASTCSSSDGTTFLYPSVLTAKRERRQRQRQQEGAVRYDPASMRIVPQIPALGRIVNPTPTARTNNNNNVIRRRSNDGTAGKKIALGKHRIQSLSSSASTGGNSATTCSSKTAASANTNNSATTTTTPCNARTASSTNKTFPFILNHSLFHKNNMIRKEKVRGRHRGSSGGNQQRRAGE